MKIGDDFGRTHKMKSKNHNYINPELCIAWLGQCNEPDLQAF